MKLAFVTFNCQKRADKRTKRIPGAFHRNAFLIAHED